MLRYITLRYVTLRYFSLHYIALHHITLRYITLRYVTLRCVTLRCLLQTDWNDGSVLVSLIQSLGGSIPGWPDHVDRSNHQAIIEKGRSGQALKPSYKKVGQVNRCCDMSNSKISCTLVPRATLRGVAELHVASGMPQWRMFVTCCYF